MNNTHRRQPSEATLMSRFATKGHKTNHVDTDRDWCYKCRKADLHAFGVREGYLPNDYCAKYCVGRKSH